MDGLTVRLRTTHDIDDVHPARPTAAVDGFSSEIDMLTPREWDRVVSEFDDLNLFQTAAFADSLRGERGMSHLLLKQNGVPVAGARVAIIKPPLFPAGIAYIKYGPFWRQTGQPKDESVYKAVLAALVDEYAARRGHMISISPRPHPVFEATEQKLLQEYGFVARSRLKRPLAFFLVNTGLGETALRASLSQKWRYNLKQAERNQLEICFRDPMEALPDYCALHNAMIARKKFSDRNPGDVLPPIFRNLPPSSSYIVTASHRGQLVAGAVLIIGGDVGYYLYGASADAALPLKAGYVLHWRIACWLAQRGIGWYDLGDGFGHLREFKQGFVGKSGAIIEKAGEFDRWLSPQARMAGSIIYGARNFGGNLRSLKRWIGKKAEDLYRPSRQGTTGNA